MKTHKHKTQTYAALHSCLEAYYGEKRPVFHPRKPDYREPEQGFRTVPFQSCPLRLDYMSRRKNRSLISRFIG